MNNNKYKKLTNKEGGRRGEARITGGIGTPDPNPKHFCKLVCLI